MADSVKVQGSVNVCIQILQEYANFYKVDYVANFLDKKQKYKIYNRTNMKSKQEPINIFFMWRSEYKEYDNSS